jgi:hypothetical protein
MREVHEGICGTQQLAHKMKWLLHRAEFYWLTIINNFLCTTRVVNRAKSSEMCNWLL